MWCRFGGPFEWQFAPNTIPPMVELSILFFIVSFMDQYVDYAHKDDGWFEAPKERAFDALWFHIEDVKSFEKWGGQEYAISSLFDSLPGIHCPIKTNLRRLWVKCKK
jgi:hypothetical protein